MTGLPLYPGSTDQWWSVNALAFNPHKASQCGLVYQFDGYYTDAGGSWSRVSTESGLGGIGAGRFHYHPTNPLVLYSTPGFYRSTDGGLTWSPLVWDDALPEPICQASLIAVGKNLYFSNPASAKREKMTVRRSRDGGRTWDAALELNPGPAAYSCLASVSKRELGCLYECGESRPYERITFAAFPESVVSP